MDGFKAALVVMAFDDMQREREHPGQCRQMTPAELDALADYGWHLPDLTAGWPPACTRCACAGGRGRATASSPRRLPSAAAPSQG